MLSVVPNLVAAAGGQISINQVTGAITATPASGQGIALNGGIITLNASTSVTAANGVGSGAAGKSITFVTGNAGSGNANGGDLIFTPGAKAGTGRIGAFLPTSYFLATAPTGYTDGGVVGTGNGWANFVTTITGATATQGKTVQSLLTFSTLSGNYAGTIAAFDATVTTDTSAVDYTGKIRGAMGHVVIQTTGGTIAKSESGAFVTITQAGSSGTLTDAYCVSGELLHSGGVNITSVRGAQGTLVISSTGNIGSGIGTQGYVQTTLGQTGTYTTTMIGVQALAQHNSTTTVQRITGTQSYVDLVASGTITTNAVGVQAYVQSAAAAVVSSNVIGIDAWVAWGSSNNQSIVYAGQFHYENTGGATLANGEGIHVGSPVISGGSVTKGRGIRIGDQSNAAVATAEGLRIDNQSRAGSISIVTVGGLHQFGATANIGAAFTVSDLTTTLYNVDTRNTSASINGTHQFVPVVATIASTNGTIFSNITARPYTVTMTGGTSINSLSGMQILVSQPTVTSASATAVTGLSSVSIAGPPILGGSVTTPAGGNSSLWVASAIATVAGGSLAAGIGFGVTGSAPTIGQYWGSGAPTISAKQGSVYWRTDGTTTNDRAYINTNGTTGWTALTTVA